MPARVPGKAEGGSGFTWPLGPCPLGEASLEDGTPSPTLHWMGGPKLYVGEPKSLGPMKRPNLKGLGVVLFVIIGAVSAALGCPFFRNPANFATAGGMVGYLKYVVDVHRKK